MKKYLFASMFLLLQLAAHAQDTKYTVTLNLPENGTLNAYAYGTSTWDKRTQFAAGEEVHLTGSLKSEYSFITWTDESGVVACDSLRYTFTMPAHDVTLTGHTEYDPENPPGPREDGYTDTWNRLYLRGNPEYGGAFTWGLGAERAQNWLVWTGYEFTVQAYPSTGFNFVGWQLDGEIISTDNPYTFIMPDRDMTLYAMYEYDPDGPVNPHANVWNKESGELIISDFTPGHLYEQVMEVTRRDPWHSDWDLVKSATIAGPSTDESLTYDYPIDIRAITYACSNVEFLDYSRTSGITKVPNGCFSKNSLKQVVLPSTITTIGKYACRNCENLTSFTCFATTPPTFEGRVPGEDSYGTNYSNDWAFTGLTLDNIIVHVPAEAVPLYQEARGWKEFMILPITQGVQKLTVSLPQANSYKDMFLELVNTKTLQSQRYVITSATSYTFNNLIHNTQHNLYLKNQRGNVLGSIEGIDIVDKDLKVSFSELKTPIDVTLRLMLPDGTDVATLSGTEGATIIWTDRQGNYLSRGATLAGQIAGSQVRCRVCLEEGPGRLYQNPADTLFSVEQDSPLIITLQPIPQRQIGGTITAASTDSPVRSATVTVSQILNGLYATSQMVKTDAQGHWALTVYEASTTITITHSDYLKVSLSVDNPSPSEESEEDFDFALRDITGTIIDLDLYYRAAIHDGEESTSEEYDGYENISYTVYDETHQAELTNLSVQYPMIVLIDQKLELGTRLRVTATSIDKKFMPVETTCSVDSAGRATATLPIIQLGKIEASFEMTDNESVVALLFDENDQLLGWAPYNGVNLTLIDIPDGRYRFITMGNSILSTSFNTFWALDNIGLKENEDYVQNMITVSSGHITEVSNEFIPAFDETGFLYTGNQTSFSVNKQEVTVGQYVTLKAQVDFKPAYEADNVQLLFDLPDGCELVEGSVMVGNHTVPYNFYNNRMWVDVESPSSNATEEWPLVRFCVVPTISGILQVTATVSADLNGRNTRQPIGSAIFTAEDLTITVPATTGRRLLPVTGMAVPLSKVEIYDNGVFVGETTSLGTGYWNAMCELDRPYNLSEHSIYAIVTTPEGLQMQSETKTVKIDRGSFTPVVTLRFKGLNHEHNTDDFVFDFRTNTVTPGGMNMRYADSNFEVSLFVDFYDQNDMLVNDTTVIRDVRLHILRESRDILSVDAPYSERHKRWEYTLGEASDYSVGHNLPINVDVEYTNVSELSVDREMIDDRLAALTEFLDEGRQHTKEIFSMTDEVEADPETIALIEELTTLWKIDNPDATTRQRIIQLTSELVGDSIMNAVNQNFYFDNTEIDALTAKESLSENELERLGELITQRIDFMASLSIEVVPESIDELMQELKNTAAEMRDSLLLVSSFFCYPDTASVVLPDGGSQYLVPVSDGRYQQIDIEDITGINHEQLLADGYEAIPINDGSYFYYLQKDGGYVLIDGLKLKQYSLKIVNESDVAPARRVDWRWFEFLIGYSASMFFPTGCFGEFDTMGVQFSKFVEQMKQSTDFYSKLESLTTNIVPMWQSLMKLLECMYNDGSSKFRLFVENRMKVIRDVLDKKWWDANNKLIDVRNKVANLTKQVEETRKNFEILNIQKKYLAAEKASAEAAGDLAKLAQYSNELAAAEARLGGLTDDIARWTQQADNLTPYLKQLEKAFKQADFMADVYNKGRKWIMGFLEKFPIKLSKSLDAVKSFSKWLFALPVAGPFLKAFPVICVIWDNSLDSGHWIQLWQAVEAISPCEGDLFAWSDLYNDTQIKMMMHLGINLGQCAIDVTSWVVDAVAGLTPGWLVGRVLDVLSCVIATFHPEASQKDRDKLWDRYYALKCKKPDPEPGDGTPPEEAYQNSQDVGTLWSVHQAGRQKDPMAYRKWNFLNLWFVRDPSGYVYEAVNSNRVEGVTTTCYYKETKEDMYGDLHDEAVLWDAETYAQENPLFTDADGRYRWDVPAGLWQVKYEKQGYETTYSDWLPVPPPQLEVNVGITQMKQPNVAKVKAYENGIDITFDKYMRPNTLKTENITVTKGGQTISGKIELLNAESGYQTPDSVYASKVRFTPLTSNPSPLTSGDKVQLTVRKAVESYAGLQMESDYTQQFSVEQRIEALIADSLINMSEDKELKIHVRALPAAAAKGRKLIVSNSDNSVLTADYSELTLDQNGEAQLSVHSQAQGTSVVRFTMADEELTTATLITVRDPAQMEVKAPKSSRLNGITMYIGSEIRLTTATAGAKILYTLDGSCPCAPESGKVITYDNPIILTGDSILIKAMAVAPGMDDSPVVTFRYKGIQRPVSIEAPTADEDSPADTPKMYFRLDGRRITRPEHGINIERYENGRVRKVTVK